MDSSGFDLHLNITVPLLHNWPPGSNASLFNSYNFTFANHSEWPGFSEHQVWYTTCVYCNFPISPNYCTLQRFLFLAEVNFALVTLALDYVWLSSIAVAAVLNYTTVAAVHWIVLQCIQGNSTLDLDNWATIRIHSSGEQHILGLPTTSVVSITTEEGVGQYTLYHSLLGYTAMFHNCRRAVPLPVFTGVSADSRNLLSKLQFTSSLLPSRDLVSRYN
jgi:hypothetical protein